MISAQSCFSLKTPLTAGNSQLNETISSEASSKGEERSTTIPQGSTEKSLEMGGVSTKKCRLCGIEKPLSEFYKRSDSGHYRSECKDCIKTLSRFRQTGWTPEAYEKAFIEQDGKCAICGCTLNSSRYTQFAGDHDHKTGKLRGLLCTNCNTALGLMKDSPIRLMNAVDYLNKYSGTDKDIV